MKKDKKLPALSKEEWKKWADLTRRIRFVNGKIPIEAFYAFCESFISPTVDVIPYRIRNNEIEILLIYRKDKYYDGFHLPGSIIVPGRTSKETLEFVISNELGESAKVSKKNFISVSDIMKGAGVGLDNRGQNLTLLYACEIDGEVLEGKWSTQENLPKNIIPEHQLVVKRSFDWIKSLI